MNRRAIRSLRELPNAGRSADAAGPPNAGPPAAPLSAPQSRRPPGVSVSRPPGPITTAALACYGAVAFTVAWFAELIIGTIQFTVAAVSVLARSTRPPPHLAVRRPPAPEPVVWDRAVLLKLIETWDDWSNSPKCMSPKIAADNAAHYRELLAALPSPRTPMFGNRTPDGGLADIGPPTDAPSAPRSVQRSVADPRPAGRVSAKVADLMQRRQLKRIVCAPPRGLSDHELEPVECGVSRRPSSDRESSDRAGPSAQGASA